MNWVQQWITPFSITRRAVYYPLFLIWFPPRYYPTHYRTPAFVACPHLVRTVTPAPACCLRTFQRDLPTCYIATAHPTLAHLTPHRTLPGLPPTPTHTTTTHARTLPTTRAHATAQPRPPT